VPSSSSLTLVFPHQLFAEHPAISEDRPVAVVEDSLFFGDPHYPLRFHKAKLVLHRASMKAFAKRHGASYHDHAAGNTIGDLIAGLNPGITDIHLCEVADYLLERRLHRAADCHGIRLHWYPTPMFLSPREFLDAQFPPAGATPMMANFYRAQRQRMDLLLDADGGPAGGRWSHDADNRKRLPKGAAVAPEPTSRPGPESRALIEEAIRYVDTHFPEHPGRGDAMRYPIDPAEARKWLDDFLSERLHCFGDYEDAISSRHRILFHSVLTPALNIGLLTPQEIVTRALAHGETHAVPINSLEGFIRQIIGWREFIRGVYEQRGSVSRNANFWNFDEQTATLPPAFYDATTGIAPIDATIRRVLDTGYCHHIERLMLLGSFMLLCEIHPHAVYRWFMELFIDAYDWVMVPNIYGMSQFADGGSFATKPYICGSNYVKKMGDYPAGDWCPAWDGLYWRFIDRHAAFFRSNHRLSMMPRLLDKMDHAKREAHFHEAERFLGNLRG
jgi:deoxyribodipyrimidine photolyase-related protein